MKLTVEEAAEHLGIPVEELERLGIHNILREDGEKLFHTNDLDIWQRYRNEMKAEAARYELYRQKQQKRLAAQRRIGYFL